MPLRYSKVLRRIFKDMLHMQRSGQLDAATDDKLREYLHTHRKALRELQRLEDKRPTHLSGPNLTRALFTREAAMEAFKHVRVPESEMWAEKRERQAADLAGFASGELSADDVNWFAGGVARNAKVLTSHFPAAPSSVVDLLVNTEQRSDEWLQQPGEHSFNDEMNGISVDKRKRMDADMSTEALGYKEYKCPKCGWVHAAIPPEVAKQNPQYCGYHSCFNCNHPAWSFVPAKPGDAPEGCTLQPVVVPGAWE